MFLFAPMTYSYPWERIEDHLETFRSGVIDALNENREVPTIGFAFSDEIIDGMTEEVADAMEEEDIESIVYAIRVRSGMPSKTHLDLFSGEVRALSRTSKAEAAGMVFTASSMTLAAMGVDVKKDAEYGALVYTDHMYLGVRTWYLPIRVKDAQHSYEEWEPVGSSYKTSMPPCLCPSLYAAGGSA